MENKLENKRTLQDISNRLRDIIREHRAGKPTIQAMADRIRERADRLERERAESLIREATGERAA